MKYCVRCLYPANHPLGIIFDDQGVCSGCRVHEEKDLLDWNARRNKLRKLLDGYRSKSGRGYDCIIPVCGARDSYFIFHTVKHEFGMNPLLVTYNKHYNTSLGIRNLAYLRTLIGGDILYQTIAPQTVQKITRHTIQKMASIYWHCLAGQTVFPVQVAVRFKIPLIIWGAHQGVDQVGMYSHLNEVEMTRRYRKDHDLLGYEAEDLLSGDSPLIEQDLRQFMYPHDKEIEKIGIRGIYLNNYIRWDSKAQHETMIEKYAYETSALERTFDMYNDVDCFHYSSLHDWIKFAKWGYGKVTDHAAREIRLRRLSRELGIELVRKYSALPLNRSNLNLFLNWVGMSEAEFVSKINGFRDARIWKQNNNSWSMTDSVANHVQDPHVTATRLSDIEENPRFKLSARRTTAPDSDRYILIGRGHAESLDRQVNSEVSV